MISDLATDGRPYIWILALFSGLDVVLILVFHDAPRTIALNLLVASVAIAVISADYLESKVHGRDR